MAISRFSLFGNPSWPRCAAELPSVRASVEFGSEALRVEWLVEETASTFRALCAADGEHCWEDSCVEIFLAIPGDPEAYCNFEFNSRGFCYAGRGYAGIRRAPLDPTDYAAIGRRATGPETAEAGRLRWSVAATIPYFLVGPRSPADAWRGNIYKCGDKTEAPHWLSAFPIEAPEPSFHRPEFFRALE